MGHYSRAGYSSFHSAYTLEQRVDDGWRTLCEVSSTLRSIHIGCLEDLKLDFPRAQEFIMGLLILFVDADVLSAAFLKRCRLLRIGGACSLQVNFFAC